MGGKEEAIKQIKKRYKTLLPVLDERSKRQWAATEAESYGRGGCCWVCEATGMSHNTIARGMEEIRERRKHPKSKKHNCDRIRKEGGGRKLLEEKDTELTKALNKLVEPATRGDPMSPLCWTSKSTYALADALRRCAKIT